MIITRFAPSPTGYIHLGNIRTAFFCWLFIKQNNGKFLIRIDDTDNERVSQKYINDILNVLHWFKMDYDDDLIFQSKNKLQYKIMLKQLIATGHAYKCFCSKNRLIDLRNMQIKNKIKVQYDGRCLNLVNKDDVDFVIRFKNNKYNKTRFFDLVKGFIEVSNVEFDDFIIAKNNFKSTYNFACVVDDINYNITHVIRGEDHISNTIKQINLIIALKKTIPKYVHLPMILDVNKNVLSKRRRESNVMYYKTEGFLYQAILNYIIKLGWSFKNQEIFSIKEMIQLFSFKNINKSACEINEQKLIWLNKYYMTHATTDYLYKQIIPIKKKIIINYNLGPDIKTLIDIYKARENTIKQIILANFYLYNEIIDISDKYLEIFYETKIIIVLLNIYSDIKNIKFKWEITFIKLYIKNIVNLNKISFSKLAIPLRILITGCNNKKPIYELFFLSGRILLLKKIRHIIKRVNI